VSATDILDDDDVATAGDVATGLYQIGALGAKGLTKQDGRVGAASCRAIRDSFE